MDFSSISFIVTIFVSLLDGGYALPSGQCPFDFERHGDQCYKAIAVQATWAEAKMVCLALGGDLARIRNDREQVIIAGIASRSQGVISNLRFWVDGSNMLARGEWRWIGSDGASIPFSYSNWQPGFPTRALATCIEVRWNIASRWINYACTVRLSFICQARLSSDHVMNLTEELYL